MAKDDDTSHDEKVHCKDSPPSFEHAETPKRRESILDVEGRSADHLNAVFENPLAGIPRDKLFEGVDAFCAQHGLDEYRDLFRRGALVSQDPGSAQSLSELSAEEKEALEREHTHKWSQPWSLYFLATMCSLAAAVQGMDETVNNGAQAIYLKVVSSEQ